MAAARSPPSVRSREEEVFASEGDDAQRAFGGVVVDLQLAIVGISIELMPAREGVADRRRRIGLARELRECVFQPVAYVIEQRSGPRLTNCFAYIGGAASDLGFDGVERGDALDRFGCDGRGMRDMNLVELASRGCPAGDFDDRSSFIKFLKPGVSIGLERIHL